MTRWIILVAMLGLVGAAYAGPVKRTTKPGVLMPRLVKKGGACGKPSDCARGLTCAGTLKVAFKCVRPKSALCRVKSACKMYGHCTAKNSRCVAGSDADCKASDICKKNGHCRLGKYAGLIACLK